MNWDDLNKQSLGITTKKPTQTTKTNKSGWDAFNMQMAQKSFQQEASSQDGVDRALFQQLKTKQISTKEINTSLAPEKVSFVEELGKTAKDTIGGLFGQALRTVRGVSQVLATPLAGIFAIPKGGATPKQAMQESLKMAKDVAYNNSVSVDKAADDAGQMWLKNRGVGKYGGKEADLADVAALGVLGVFNLFGDPAFEFGALKPAAKSLKEFATFKKVGQVTKEFKPGTTIVKGTEIVREIKISNDLKIKIKPKENTVVFEGYKKRFPSQKALPDSQMAKETQDLVINTREATGMEMQARFVGDDLVLKPTQPITKTLQPTVKSNGKYPTIHEGGEIKMVEGEPVKIVDGVETFLHKDENGNWVVSEATTGRDISGGAFTNSNFAIKEAKANIEQNGIDKFKQLISEKQLPVEKTKPQVSLIEEAKKYKSAEEFVKSQGETVYRGGKDLSKENITNSGISVSKGKNVAEDFVKQKGGTVQEHLISPDAKIIDYADVPNVKLKNLNDYSPELDTGNKKIWKDLEVEYQKAVDWAKSNGYDAVKLPLEGETRVINPDILKTKSQLTDIWDKAQASTEISDSFEIPKMGGETKQSKLGVRVKEEAIEDGLIKQMRGLPEYETMNMKEQAKLATDLINSNLEKAKRIAMGQEMPDGKLLSESVFIAMKNWAKQNKDVNLMRQLAKSHTVEQATFMGQRIRALGETDPNDPVKIIRDIEQLRAKKVSNKPKEALTAEQKKIQHEIKMVKKTEKDLEDFIQAIKC